MNTVRAVDISVSSRRKHALVSGRWTPEAVRCWIVLGIGFSLDDGSTNALDKHRHANQIPGHGFSISAEEVGINHSIFLF